LLVQQARNTKAVLVFQSITQTLPRDKLCQNKQRWQNV